MKNEKEKEMKMNSDFPSMKEFDDEFKLMGMDHHEDDPYESQLSSSGHKLYLKSLIRMDEDV